MRTLKRILVFILFTMALIGAVGGLKYKKVYAVDYVEVMTEDFEGYDTDTTYNSTRVAGDWTFYYGTISTDSVISDTKSGHMRYYKSASSNYPYADYSFGVATTIDKIVFNYAAQSGIIFDVKYSSDGVNYTLIETVTPTKTSKTAYSKVLDSSLSITNFRIHVSSSSTAPGSGSIKFRIDDVALYAEAHGEQLTTPTNAAISDTTLSFNAVTHASSYNVGFFESEAAESPAKVVNINTTAYTFTQQSTDGNNYIKIQAVGDGVNYTNSAYSYVGTYTYTDIPVKTIAQVSGFESDSSAPYSYYDITGTVISIEDASNASFTISDGANNLSVYRLTDTKGGSPKTIEYFGFLIGDTVRIKAYKETTSGGRLRGYFVSYTPDYGKRFETLKTSAALKVDYTSNMSTAPAESVATMTLPTSSLGNVAANVSHASELGFSNSLFTMISSKNSAGNNTFIATDSFRLYAGSGNGGSVTITGQSGIKISKIVITLMSGNASATTVTGDSAPEASIVDLVRTYTFDSPSSYATIQNTGTEKAFISAMTIYYSGSYASSYTINTETVAAEEKPLLSLMFGSRFSNELKGNLDGSGTVVTYGIAYAKTDDLTGASKSLVEALDAGDSFVHTVEGTPVKVDADGTANESGDYSQIGVSLNHIPETSYGTEITAAVYVFVDGTYYLMNTKAYSIKSIALAYRTSDCTGYEEHLGLLGYLATYGD